MSTVTTNYLFERLKSVKVGAESCLFTREKCAEIAPIINEINDLKREKNAIILAHSYVSPEIQLGVADFVGDSYELSKKAKAAPQDMIVFAAVKFMAETAKVLNPTKQVVMPNKLNGCTLADSITGQNVRDLRQRYPDHVFVCYINTSADVKAECDVCVTSSNVVDIIASIPHDNIYFLPDKYMGENIINSLRARNIHKEVLFYDGLCYVHETYDPEMIQYLRLQYPDIDILSHPECSSAVCHESDYVGSTSQMINYVKNSQKETFFLLTECGLSSRLQVEEPTKNFVGSCTLCKYMKSNTLTEILRVLKSPDQDDIISLDESLMNRARSCIDAMFTYTT